VLLTLLSRWLATTLGVSTPGSSFTWQLQLRIFRRCDCVEGCGSKRGGSREWAYVWPKSQRILQRCRKRSPELRYIRTPAREDSKVRIIRELVAILSMSTRLPRSMPAIKSQAQSGSSAKVSSFASMGNECLLCTACSVEVSIETSDQL
jgi:hypothetical protein